MQLNLQNGASPLIEQLNFFHDWVMMFVVGFTCVVLWYITLHLVDKPMHRRLIESQWLELGWTFFPIKILL